MRATVAVFMNAFASLEKMLDPAHRCFTAETAAKVLMRSFRNKERLLQNPSAGIQKIAALSDDVFCGWRFRRVLQEPPETGNKG